MNYNYEPKEPPDFSLVLGGPLFQLLMRMHLTTPALDLLKRRIVCITLFAWLPLLFFAVVDGKAWKDVGLPFLQDIEAQVRFLVALPLLIAAELQVHKRLRLVVGEFSERNIVTEKMLPKFRELIASAMKLRNSVAVELILLFVLFVGGHFLWTTLSNTEKITTSIGTWYATIDGAGVHPTLAGYWYIFVSMPLFQFIGFRWYWRLFIWARFLWQSSRLELNLISTHPDRAAGLEFLGMSIPAFSPLIIAHGVLLAGLIANPIIYAGAKLTDYTTLILIVTGFLLLIILGPLLIYAPALMSAKRKGLREYGTLASKYIGEFDNKWIHGDSANDQLLGSSDIQSLADMGNSFQVVREIRPFPFGKDAVFQLVALVLIPVFPLVLTMVPLEELIKEVLRLFF